MWREWRIAALAGLSAGLAASPLAAGDASTAVLAGLGACVACLVALRPRRGRATIAWIGLVALAGAAAGLVIGAARVRALDDGALRGDPGQRIAIRGYVEAVPRRTPGATRIQVSTPAGRLLVEATGFVGELDVGEEIEAAGVLARPPAWYAGTLERRGVAMVLRTDRVAPRSGRRGGLAGRLDAVRAQAETALGSGIGEREAALARGFVLGQDDEIDARTTDDFRRSGLAHLLAVSGQNVILLALLAAPLLAALGLPLGARLAWTCVLIAVYVPLAGGGPSIQRAGVMGAAGIIAVHAGRPASRLFALLAATAVTLAVNPRASGDVGWQLSFAAVAGIFVLAGPVRDALLAGGRAAPPLRRALAEGVALTFAATLATAPLTAHHFGALPATTLAANLVALPAVAPAMWLGMIVAALGQLPWAPLAPFNWLNERLLAYIAEVASVFAAPDWALLEVRLSSPAAVAAAYAALLLVTGAALRLAAAARAARARRGPRGGNAAPGPALAVGMAAAVLLVATLAPARGAQPPAEAPGGGSLRVSVLDVGQGDAILLQPPGARAVLVDTGPAGEDLSRELEDAGVERLAAVALTHDQSDHAGGLPEIAGRLPVDRFLYARAGRRSRAAAAAAGAVTVRLAAGDVVRLGGLRLTVLWPPPEVARRSGKLDDPNLASLVLLARWRRFEMLLPGDAEAEAVPLDPGPIDVLKVAHHGSEDGGLPALLHRTRPQLAVISAGAGNPFGHPAPATLATLRRAGTRTLRTDLSGTIVIEVGAAAMRTG